MESCNTKSSLDLPLESLSLQSFLQSLHKEQWQEVRLGEVAEIVSGGTPKTSIPEYWNGEIPWLSVADFNNGKKYVVASEKFITQLGLQESSTKLLQRDDIIISARGTVGVIAMIPYPMAFNQSCYGLRICSNAHSHFIYYCLKVFTKYFIHQSYGAVFDTITTKILSDFTFLLPPLTIQQKIAEILSSFDDKIDLLHRQNKTLESLALTLFRHYFIDNPKRDEWEEKPLSEIAEIQNGYAFKNSDYAERGMETYEVLKMGHIESGGGLRYFPKAHYVKINDKMTKWVLNEDDIVLAMTDMKDSLGILGYPAMVDKSNYYVLNQRVARIYLKSKDDFLHNYFLFLYLSLQENIQKLQSLANGGVQVNLSTEAIKNFTITIPPLEFQSQNNQAFINIIKKYKNNRKQIQNLQAMRDMLLKAIFA
ncbi:MULTISPECIES: restriction endonuclease subunit S [Helicobacter]|uniref:Type I restriction modification DNA specificity domain-containing protein n=1 Tax=Helicobacter bilis ATCC 43879 TaxID=613026 RepID=C3XI84_9HELI|nr:MULTISPECIES: restriction endonuclease subunit S [Helicobacter]EEO24723.2 hypothetical protein HRAG_01780 [Helicobacter bilis ATCC 43879]